MHYSGSVIFSIHTPLDPSFYAGAEYQKIYLNYVILLECI